MNAVSVRGNGFLSQASPKFAVAATAGEEARASMSFVGLASETSRGLRIARKAGIVEYVGGKARFKVEGGTVPELVPEDQPGATKPLGFFDPLGFTRNPLMTYENDPNGFRHLREAEIKHGRVAMMGSVGNFVAHFYKLPGFEDVPAGLKALGTQPGALGFTAIITIAGLLEFARGTEPQDQPGSYGDPFSLGNYTLDWRNRELNNGRMAMFAVIGQIGAEMATGLDPAQQFGFS